MKTEFDAIVIGGGFFGTQLAINLKKYFPADKIIVLEKETDLLRRASYNNQARVHNGYHYPRSFLTAYRSHVSFAKFIKDYPEVLVSNFEKLYAIGRKNSKVSSDQFKNFMHRVGSPLEIASSSIKNFFNEDLVEQVFVVREIGFNARKLKDRVWEDLKKERIKVWTETKAQKVEKTKEGYLDLLIDKKGEPQKISSKYVFNSTYSQINELLSNSGLRKIKLKHELTEMPLIQPPKSLEGYGITMMCGPFFSMMPFPDKNAYTLSHVRYTPHCQWWDGSQNSEYLDSHQYLQHREKKTHFPAMIRDVTRYLPVMKSVKFLDESIWEVKTVLPLSEENDGRPILFQRHLQMPNLTCIMGGKIDNIYDIPEELNFLEN